MISRVFRYRKGRSGVKAAAGPCALLLLANLGCGLGDGTLEEVDPASIPAEVTYTQHIKPRMEYFCVACHNPDASLGNAGGWDLSTYLLVRASYDSIATTSFLKRTMPPGGARRLTAEDEAYFNRWEALGFPEKPTLKP